MKKGYIFLYFLLLFFIFLIIILGNRTIFGALFSWQFEQREARALDYFAYHVL